MDVLPAAALVVFLVGFPDVASSAIDALFGDLCCNFGWLFLGVVVIIAVFSVCVAVSPLGSVKFGGPDEPKQYNNFSWAAIMFTAGLGTALVVMSYLEPIMFLDTPPFGIERLSDEAFEFALVPDQFLYGFLAWLVNDGAMAPSQVSVNARNLRFMPISAVESGIMPV